MLGHSSLSITARYLHLSIDDLACAINGVRPTKPPHNPPDANKVTAPPPPMWEQGRYAAMRRVRATRVELRVSSRRVPVDVVADGLVAGVTVVRFERRHTLIRVEVVVVEQRALEPGEVGRSRSMFAS